MTQQNDPKWEVVDEIPGERPKEAPSQPAKTPLFKRKTLWLGVGIGVALVFAIPVLRILAGNLIRAWWLWLPIAAYYLYRRLR
ncbi:hypothetical protein [Pelagicoccus sp. SDUM812003]|uniref:hypothetical protein n=1 Tax=Pelagicoccus sp. SDUM812003 TaxID=3041267 RepID=UPI00280FB036|nr:hypothetical protein [Pelagicoccus sp. SDUM812003]MDQ8204977.1 hypothetical protein [Pelagicoccus sp. SDUM812003]